MKTTKIGIITYKQYEENILLNDNFNADELFAIMLTDKDFKKFEVFGEKMNLLLSTQHYPAHDEPVARLKIAKMEKEVEILGRTYDAYKSPSLKIAAKVTWKVDGYTFKSKKKALELADEINRRAKEELYRLISITKIKNHE